MNVKDITIWYPLKCNDKYVPTSYSFNGIITSFSNAEEAFKFIKKSFLTKKECISKCQELNSTEVVDLTNELWCIKNGY